MEITFRAATVAATLGLLLLAGSASAQEVETGPRRAGPAFSSPDAERAEAARPTGAAPAPEQPGPLGEPAPPAAGAVEGLAEAGAADSVARAPEVEAVESAASATEGDGLLGSPVPTPTRRSFLPIARTNPLQSPIPVLGSAWGLTGEAFVDEQLRHPRVVDAQLEAKFDLKALFAERGLTYPPRDLYFRLFKQEQVLEVWVRDAPAAETYTLLREYAICAIPGRLGPKTRVDDFQAPEGFYYIQGFNPESEFHLSLRLNYPNVADRIIGVTDSWGGDIYIHGGCSTVGCFPMTDEAMRELYWLAVEARGAGQTIIPVHVFPARLENGVMRWLSGTFARDRQLLAFWENLREGYTYFEEHRRLPVISVDGSGRYLFSDPAAPEIPAPVEFGTVEVATQDGPLGAPVETPVPVETATADAPAPIETVLVDEAAPVELAPVDEAAPVEPAEADEPTVGPVGLPLD